MTLNNQKTTRGSSLIELLVCLSFAVIFALSSSANIGLNSKKVREKILLGEIEDLSKSLIASSRFALVKSRIIIRQTSSLNIELIFIHDTKIIHTLQLPKKDFKLVSFKTNSAFNEQIEIHPNGFVSPASLTVSTSNTGVCSLFFSRLGNVRKDCKA